MDTLFFLVPLALLLGAVGLGLMLWAVRSGQFEDMEGPAHRILYDDDQAMMPIDPQPRPDDADDTRACRVEDDGGAGSDSGSGSDADSGSSD